MQIIKTLLQARDFLSRFQLKLRPVRISFTARFARLFKAGLSYYRIFHREADTFITYVTYVNLGEKCGMKIRNTSFSQL